MAPRRGWEAVEAIMTGDKGLDEVIRASATLFSFGGEYPDQQALQRGLKRQKLYQNQIRYLRNLDTAVHPRHEQRVDQNPPLERPARADDQAGMLPREHGLVEVGRTPTDTGVMNLRHEQRVQTPPLERLARAAEVGVLPRQHGRGLIRPPTNTDVNPQRATGVGVLHGPPGRAVTGAPTNTNVHPRRGTEVRVLSGEHGRAVTRAPTGTGVLRTQHGRAVTRAPTDTAVLEIQHGSAVSCAPADTAVQPLQQPRPPQIPVLEPRPEEVGMLLQTHGHAMSGVVRKTLTCTDVNPHDCRLKIPKLEADAVFLPMLEEGREVEKGMVKKTKAKVYDNVEGRMYAMEFKTWSGGVSHVLSSPGWNRLCERHGLKEHDVVDLRLFRDHENEVCFFLSYLRSD